MLFLLYQIGAFSAADLLSVFSCHLTISDSCPVQFWDVDEDTFNQTEICGIPNVCFCQPWQCDDEITIQFFDTGTDFTLCAISENTFANLGNFSSVSSDYWQLSFAPEDFDICDSKRQLLIMDTTTAEGMKPFYIIPTNEWTDGAFGFTSKTSPNLTKGGGTSGVIYEAIQTVSIPVGSTIPELTFTVRVFGPGVYTWTVSIGLVGSSYGHSIFNTGQGQETVTVTFPPEVLTVAGGAATELRIGYSFNHLSADPIVAEITVPVGTVLVEDADFPANSYAKSDCLDMKTSQECTEFISYTNTKNFDGIDYETAPLTLGIRVPAQFWKTNNPQEQESTELSNGEIVMLRQSIKQRKLLELDYLPDYFKLKLQKILMHDTVTIEGDEWRMLDGYEAEPVKKFKLGKSQIWLTLSDSVERNTI